MPPAFAPTPIEILGYASELFNRIAPLGGTIDTAPTTIALVVPLYNPGADFRFFWQAVETSLTALTEIIFVDDASTDDTEQQIDRVRASAPHLSIRVVRHAKNLGRFQARWSGAKAATTTHVLFLDPRVVVPEGFGSALTRLVPQHPILMGLVNIDVTQSLFNLYWERTHERIFWRHYQASRQPFSITVGNYDQFLKGTTVFCCERTLFLHACEQFPGGLLNDDTALLKMLVQRADIRVEPALAVFWHPRQELRPFLGRLWERGPSFVEYHVFLHQGFFFYVVFFSLAALLAIGAISIWHPLLALVAIASIGATTALFSRTPTEFIRLLPLHTLVVLTFGVGVLRGLWINSLRFIRFPAPLVHRG